MRILPALALAVSLAPLAAHAARTTEMKDPVVVQLETQASMAQVKKAVKLAVLGRRWVISNESGNSFVATYTRENKRENLMAKIRVSYDAKKVTIKYVASEGLSAEGGQIHPTYNKWIAALEKDIPIFLQREVTASE